MLERSAGTTARARAGRPRRPTKQRAVGLFGRGLRIGLDLPPEQIDAGPVLAYGLCAPALASEQLDETTVDGFLQGIDAERLPADGDRFLDGAGRRPAVEQRGHGRGGLSPEPLARSRHPGVEAARAHVDTIEKLAGVEGDRPGQRLVGPLGEETLERHHVYLDLLEPHGALVGGDATRRCARQRSADGEERLAQAAPRLIGGGLAPEQGGQSLATLALAGREGEEREQCLRLPEGEADRPMTDRRLKATEEDESEACHRDVSFGDRDSSTSRP